MSGLSKSLTTRPTGVQSNKAAKLSTMIVLTTKHADCRIAFKLRSIQL